MAETEGIWFVCPRCGASNLPGTQLCFLCGHPVDPATAAAAPAPVPARAPAPAAANPYAPPVDVRSGTRGFHLDSMLLVIALVAVCMGVIHEAPGLGIPLAFLSFIALARTVIYTTDRSAGQRASIGDKVAVFFATIGIALIVLFCVVIALFATCLAICFVAMAPAQQGNVGFAIVSVPFILAATLGVLWILTRFAGSLSGVGKTGPGRSGKGKPRGPF